MKKHYLMIDKHNSQKAHHITIEWDGTGITTHYNQAITCARPDHIRADKWVADKPSVPGFENWYDFYTDELVFVNGDHGYQSYIDAAYQIYVKRDKILVVGDSFDTMINQGDRTCYVLATMGHEALVEYEMPAGRTFMQIVNRHDKSYIRTMSENSMPKKWSNLI